MTRQLRKVYVALFLALLLLLGALSVKGLGSFDAPPDSSVVDGKLTRALESHYDQKFPVKRLGHNVWAALEYMLFGTGRPGVVVGLEQWLFSDEEFKPVVNAERNIDDNWALIRGVRDELAKRDIRLVLAIVPAKNRLYPEYMGDNRPTALRDELFQQFHNQASEAAIVAPDLLTPLRRTKQQGPVFLRTDTHWTPLGAEVVAQQLGKAIRSQALLNAEPTPFVTEVGAEKKLEGDLITFLPLDPLFADLLPPPDVLQQRTTHKAKSAADADLFGEEQIPVALVGTSYSANPDWNFDGALREALMSDLTNHAESGRGPMLPMLKYLQSDDLRDHPPQVVIWEYPERYLPMTNDLSDFDPSWIARLKNGQAERQQLAKYLHEQ